MSEKGFVCPRCNSKECEISQRFIHEKMQYEYSFRCLDCNHEITSLGNFQRIMKEMKKELEDE